MPFRSDSFVLPEAGLPGIHLRLNQRLESGHFKLKPIDSLGLLRDDDIAIINFRILLVGHALRLVKSLTQQKTNLKLTVTIFLLHGTPPCSCNSCSKRLEFNPNFWL